MIAAQFGDFDHRFQNVKRSTPLAVQECLNQYICRVYNVHNFAVLKRIVVASAKRLNLCRDMFLSKSQLTTQVPLPTTFVSDIFQTNSFPKEKEQ